MPTLKELKSNIAKRRSVSVKLDAAEKAKSRRLITSFILPIALTLTAIVFLIVAAEFVLGMTGLGDDEYIKVDPVLGITHLENKNCTFRQEGFSRSRLSSAGLRDIEHVLVKPAGVKRIAFLGDSKTQALQVNIPETFVRLVENKLNAELNEKENTKYETINFGMSNYGIIQEFVQFLTRVRSYSPDYTVVVYHIFDSSENLPSLGRLTLPAPTVSINSRDEMAVDYNFLDRWLATPSTRYMLATDWLRRNSHIYQCILSDDFMMRSASSLYTKIADRIMAPIGGALNGAMSNVSTTSLGNYEPTRKAVQTETLALDKKVSHEKVWGWEMTSTKQGDAHVFKKLNDSARDEMEITARIFRMLNLACRDANSKLIVVPLPAPNNSLFYFREIECLKKMAKEEGFTLIDASSKFPSLAPMEKHPTYYTGHFSPMGHRMLADMITEGLKPVLKN